MEKRFLDKLDRDLRHLVQEIEEFAGSEIEVRPTPAPSQPTGAGPKAVALIASEEAATLFCRDENDFHGQAVLHELLHLRRYWVDGVPQLLPVHDADGANTKIANEIENALEHLVIVPQEAQYGFDSSSRWTETAGKNWHAYPWPDISEPWARRKHGLLSWLTTSFLAGDAEVRRLAQESLGKERLLTEAEKFTHKIARVLDSKERCVATAVKFLRIPRDEAVLVYLDIKGKRLRREAVPWR